MSKFKNFLYVCVAVILTCFWGAITLFTVMCSGIGSLMLFILAYCAGRAIEKFALVQGVSPQIAAILGVAEVLMHLALVIFLGQKYGKRALVWWFGLIDFDIS